MRTLTGYAAVVLLLFCSILTFNTSADDAVDTRTGHGLTLYGKLKYDPDFEHFEYVNLEAPKGGTYTFGFPIRLTVLIPISSSATRPRISAISSMIP